MTQAVVRSAALEAVVPADLAVPHRPAAARPIPVAATTTMQTVTLDLASAPHQYRVVIAAGLLDQLGSLMREVAPADRAALILDVNLANQFGPVITNSVQAAGYNGVVHTRTFDEQRKTLITAGDLYNVLVKHKLERTSPVVAIGGGVTGDTVGFVASTYLRGLPFIQVPTTLLSMVDASVGGKVGVNLPQGKNLVGAFHQPALVVIDTNTLETLPRRELRSGLAECVKHAVIRRPERFDWLEEHAEAILNLEPQTLVELVHWNVEVKAKVVMADEREKGERAHLNLGHTFGHAFEAVAGYGRFAHGEAVALGMVAAARVAVAAGLCDPDLPPRLGNLLAKLGLPTHATDLPANGPILEAMSRDKKVSGGHVRLVLPTRLGEVIMRNDVPEDLLVDALNSLREARG